MADDYRRLDDSFVDRHGRAPSRLAALPSRRISSTFAVALALLAVSAAVVAAVAALGDCRPPGLRGTSSPPQGLTSAGASLANAVQTLPWRVGVSNWCALALAPLVVPAVLGALAALLGVTPQSRSAFVWDGSVLLWQDLDAQKFYRRPAVKLCFVLFFAGAVAGLPLSIRAGSSSSASRLASAMSMAGVNASADNTSDNTSDLTSGEFMAHELFLHPHAVMGFIGTSATCIFLLFCVAPKVLDTTVKFLIESLDRLILGTDVYLDKISVNVFRRSFVISNLRVRNWTGFTQHDHMVTIESIEIALNIWPTLRSCGKTVELRRLHLEDLEVFMEMKQDSMLPNVTHMVEYMDGVRRDDTGTKVAHQKTEILMIVHEVKIMNIGVHLPIGSFKVSIEDIIFKDLQEIAEKEGLKKLPDIVQFIMKKVGDAAANVGREYGQKIRDMGKVVGSRAMYGAKKAEEDMRKVLEDAGAVLTNSKTDFETGIRELLSHTGLMSASPARSKKSTHLSSPDMEISADGDPVVTAETLEAFRMALTMSGVEPRFLVPDSGMEENHFRYLAEATCCFVAVGHDGETAAIFKAMCHQLGRSRQKKIPQADFVKWLNDT